MEISNLIPHIEALIFASDKPLTSMELTELINNAFGFMEDKITLDQIESSIEGILEKYQSEFYPFEIRQSGGGWQFLTKRDYHKTVAQLNGEKFLKRLSTAALETLSIIAYKQPVTKAEIEAIRGVSSDYAVQKLLEKDLIVITGRNETMPGHPLVYATSKSFMDYFGINTAEDLPKLKEIFDENLVTPTMMNEGMAVQEESASEELVDIEGEVSEDTTFVVTETGELLVEIVTEEPASETMSEEEIEEAAEELEAAEEEVIEEEEEFQEPDTEEEGEADGEEPDETDENKEDK